MQSILTILVKKDETKEWWLAAKCGHGTFYILLNEMRDDNEYKTYCTVWDEIKLELDEMTTETKIN